MFTASLIPVRGRGALSLDDRVGRFADAPEPNATVRQILMHTSEGGVSVVLNESTSSAGRRGLQRRNVPRQARQEFRVARHD
jgi:CubicO group peptidase (beta-lactamase class C family)